MKHKKKNLKKIWLTDEPTKKESEYFKSTRNIIGLRGDDDELRKKTIWKRKLGQVHRWRRGGASCVVLGRGLGPQRTLQGMCLWS